MTETRLRPMSLDRSMRTTFENYATLFLFVACVTVPVQVGYLYIFRDVVAVREIHQGIEELSGEPRVRDVGQSEIESYRTAGLWTGLATVALLPLLGGGARCVIAASRRGELPLVRRAWTGCLAGWRAPVGPAARPADLAAGLAVGVAVAWLVGSAGALLVEPVPRAVAFGPLGVVRGAALAAGGPFLLVPLALLFPTRPQESRAPRTP
jgi:hypothetical protein